MLHVGGVRTALYNWLFARHNQGTFILRIEDTDVERNSQEAVEVITSGLKWVGLNWDEGPIFQSQRQDAYHKAAKYLEEKGFAYRSTKGAEDKGEALVFKSPGKSMQFDDLVKGHLEKPAEDIVDFVIMRSNGFPTYNFACVVDDIDMNITHVIRGDDHVENTFRQILLYEAFVKPMPQFAHLPMIHNEQGQKLSKRDGAVAVTDYQEQGYLPQAIVNYLALLGWSPGDDSEFMPVQELIDRFDLARVRRSPSRFDFKKFQWLNSQHLQKLPVEELCGLVRPYTDKAGYTIDDEEWFRELVKTQQGRMNLLSEFTNLTAYFFNEVLEYDEKGFKKFVANDVGRRVLATVLEKLPQIEFSEQAVEEMLRQMAESLQVGFAKVAQPIRVAISGRTATPGIFETMKLIGKDKVLERVRKALDAAGKDTAS
jgi:glutamyl-tRNA synthetase